MLSTCLESGQMSREAKSPYKRNKKRGTVQHRGVFKMSGRSRWDEGYREDANAARPCQRFRALAAREAASEGSMGGHRGESTQRLSASGGLTRAGISCKRKGPSRWERRRAFRAIFGSGLLSHMTLCSIIGEEELNYRVRNGIGCTLFSMAAKKFSKYN